MCGLFTLNVSSMRYADENGFYELNDFPGCSQIVVSNNALIYKHKRGKGRGQEAHHFKLKKAKIMGYDYMLCTVISTNAVQIHILEKNGWKKLDEFVSRKTENTVIIYGRQLLKTPIKTPV